MVKTSDEFVTSLESPHLIIWCHKDYFQCHPQIIMGHLLKGKSQTVINNYVPKLNLYAEL